MTLVFALQQCLPDSSYRLEQELRDTDVRRWLYFGDSANEGSTVAA